ncbi:LEAF RUST 10 DISEASE-RESISTANCE LOCUS RECEPTOR-LIKE PROTEIN KINASE-like 2.5 isoform X2 [Argentina anserina]|uniref:LEAF RUST 10 DISEASE-RESISTANCE LOCUS RECEPTOR-LIKE PROTEIN KINASE-like 2.5 isoform X2 n=1 Tax=Argentina anserina TaxID=57926 RepID=UPI00217692A6|nr:LEAF RUST 10 DISEASE-RESISTANCE LOCUS RECEPTOR-LIKE PROTEIN KINASE-like 2.5 isoform X2 [Potentilla anserina]
MRKGSTTSTILFPVLIFLLFTIQVQARNLNEVSCSSSCGDIHNIKYPFRLRGDPSSCGDPDYEFSCVNNKTILEIYTGKYYVRNISYTDNLLRLVDVNFANGSCSLPSGSIVDRDGYVQDFRYRGQLNYSTESRIRFIKCSSNVTLQSIEKHYNYTEVPCLTRNGSYMYAVQDGMYLANNYPRTCSLVSVAPVDYHEDVYKSPTYEAMVKVLQAGFDLGWSVECRNCQLADYHELTRSEANLIILALCVAALIGLVIIVAILVCVIRKFKKRKQPVKNLQNQLPSTL